MKIFLATWWEDSKGRHLTAAGIDKRLISYVKMTQDPYYIENLRRYYMTGIIPSSKGETDENLKKRIDRNLGKTSAGAE